MVSQAPKLKNFMVCREKIKLSPIIAPAGTIVPNEVFFSYSLDRNLFAPTQIGKYFSMYDEWINNGITIEIVPAEPTNTAGLLWVVVDPDAADTLTGGTVKNANFLSGHKGAREHSVFGEPWSVRLPGSSRKLFCDAPAVTSVNSGLGNNDIRNSSAGNVTFLASDGFTLSSTQIASAWAHVDFLFHSPALTDDADVYACMKAACYTGSTITGNQLTWNTGIVAQTVANGIGVGGSGGGSFYLESSYNAGLFNSGVSIANGELYLPAGQSYYFKQQMYFGSAPGSTSFSISGSTSTFSTDCVAAQTASTWPPEWEGTPSGLVTLANGLTLQGEIRATSSGGSTPWAPFAIVTTTTNSTSLTGFILYIARLPSNISSPFKAHFPKGNNSQSIEIVNPAISQFMTCVPPSKIIRNVLLRNDDYQQFLDWQRNKLKYLQFDVDAKDSSDLKNILLEEKQRRIMVMREPETPESPEVVENPMTKSVHINQDVASRLLSLVGRK